MTVPADPPARGTERTPIVGALAALAFFILLAAVHTWPLASAPGRLSRNDTADTILHEWILAWVVHQVATDPLHLFDANIFYPERYTLAYSDHLFVQSMFAAPLIRAGASPVLAHNLVLLAGFALTGWTTCLVLRRWTGSWTAGAVSGSIVAFNSFSLTRLPQIQDLHLEFFPLALAALDRLLANPRAKHGLTLAGWYVLQALTGTYVMVFSALSLLAAFLSRPGEWLGERTRRIAGPIALAIGAASVLLLPFLIPYYRARETVNLGRSLEETARFSAEWTDYLAAGSRVHFNWWSKPFFAGDALFPGAIAMALAAIALVVAVPRDRRARMTLAFGVAALALSFGPAFPPYRWLYYTFPVLQGIRGAVRFGQFAIAAIGILAGFGVAWTIRRAGGRRAGALAAMLVALVNGEALMAPMGFTEYRGIAPIFDALRNVPQKSVLVYFPFYPSPQFHMNAPFMLVLTRTWQPMVNGYSGFKPASFYRNAENLASFPDAGSIQHLLELGVTHVLVDARNMRPEALARIPDFPQLHLWQTDGNLSIYLLTR